MRDPSKTDQELVEEISVLKEKIRQLEHSASDRKRIEEALRESEERYRVLVENASDIVFRTDDAGLFTYVNTALIRISGYEGKEIIGQHYTMLIPPDRREDVAKFFGRQFVKKIPNTYFEYPVVVKGNREIWLGQNTQLIFQDGKVIAFQAVARDITERKRAQEALTERDIRFKKLSTHVPGMIYQFTKKPDGTYCVPFTTEAIKNIFGCSPEDVREDFYAIARVVLPEDLDKLVSSIESSAESMTTWQCEYRVQIPGQPIRWMFGHSTPEKLADGSIIWHGFNTDITDSKLAEEALRESERKYRLLADKMRDVVFITDLNLSTLYVSPSIKAQLGFTPEERMAQNLQEQLTPASLAAATDALAKEFELEQRGNADPDRNVTLEVEYYHKDGSTRWVENILSGIRDERGVAVGLHGVSRDITERRKAEHDLKESFKRLRKSLEATVQAIAVTVETRDPYTAGHQRRVTDLARSIATEMGLSSEQIEGLRMAGKIHDIGKIAVPAEILSTPRRLTAIEFSLIKMHVQSGYDILKGIEFPWPIARIVLEHHERMDGSGYPNGLTGDHLLLESRILSVADVVEAMATHRPYRPALGIDAALEEIAKNKGLLYDPDAVDTCLRLFKQRGYEIISP